MTRFALLLALAMLPALPAVAQDAGPAPRPELIQTRDAQPMQLPAARIAVEPIVTLGTAVQPRGTTDPVAPVFADIPATGPLSASERAAIQAEIAQRFDMRPGTSRPATGFKVSLERDMLLKPFHSPGVQRSDAGR